MITVRSFTWIAAGLLVFATAGCSGAVKVPSVKLSVQVTVTPGEARLAPGEQLAFTATVTGVVDTPIVAWSVREGDAGGHVSSAGIYTAPATPGTYAVVALEQASGVSAQAIVMVALTQDRPPVISSFAATPAALPAGGGLATLAWQVSGASTITIDGEIGTVSGSALSRNVSATTVFTLTATNPHGSSQASTTVYVDTGATGWDPAGGSYAAMMSPQDGETFVPSVAGLVDLRLAAAARDIGAFATQVRFMVDADPIPLLTVNQGDGGLNAGALATSADFWVYRGFAKRALTAGAHTIFARATISGSTVESAPIVITVEKPDYARTQTLSGNVVDLSAAGLATLVGTPEHRIRVDGAGYSISGSSAVDWQFVDFYDVGSSSTPDSTGISVTAGSGAITVQNCRFFYSNPASFVANGTASASIRANTWASNVRQLAGQFPADSGSPAATEAVTLGGISPATKAFAGNNVGAGYVRMRTGTSNWTLGGDREADANILIGPRIGFYFEGASITNTLVRGNYSHFPYWGGWSQAGNFELNGAQAIVEHNVIALGSWPVRGVDTTFRYNLVIGNNEGGIWTNNPANNAFIHHNLVVGNTGGRGGLYVIYPGSNVRAFNNTYDFIDGRNNSGNGEDPAVYQAANTVDLKSNIFANILTNTQPGTVTVVGGTMTADYNQFYNVGTVPHYSGAAAGAHDSSSAPAFTRPATHYFYWTLRSLWTRAMPVSQIRADYRARYTPQSPVAGDTSIFGAGNTIGAIGATAPASAYDLFGRSP